MFRDLGVLYRLGSPTGLTDRQLLERLQSAGRADDRDAAEAALTALVERHAAMVWDVCRSLIGDRHDAEDAFQATFLILVRKAATLRVVDTLGPWLHVVAYRSALGVRTAASRRREVERSAAARPVEANGPDCSPSEASELRAAIHAELMSLPESFRAAVVLCELQGLAYSEAAGRLGIPLGTLQSRLARARLRLRRGLRSRGFDATDAGAVGDPSPAPLLGPIQAAGPLASPIGRVGRLGARVACDPAQLGTAVGGSVRILVARGLRSLSFGRLKRALAAGLAVALVGGALLYTDARSGQDVPGAARERAPQARTDGPIEIPAPFQVRATSGAGKTRLYLRDRDGERIPHRRGGQTVGFQDAEREIRWVVVTGKLDHRALLKSLSRNVGESLPPAGRLYRRAELERQTRRDEGSWSGWSRVDMEANSLLLDDLPSTEVEPIWASYRVDALVDPLPHLTWGEWRGVDVEGLTPTEEDLRRVGADGGARPPGPPRDRPPILMVRALDFTVEPGRIYRHRARVVLFNPRYNPKNRGDRKEVFGPWSDATSAVAVPPP